MKMFEFSRDFPWWGPNPNCKGCAMVLYMFKAGRRALAGIPDEAVADAEQQGVGKKVNYEAMTQ